MLVSLSVAVLPGLGARGALVPPASAAVVAPPRARVAASSERPAIFGDIVGLWDATQVMRLEAAGIIRGEADALFKPWQALTRASLAVMLQRAFDPPAATGGIAAFGDVPAGGWDASAIGAVVGAGWMRGTGHGFQPAQPVTRAEAVTAVVRALRLPPPVGPTPAFRDAASIPAWAAQAVDAAVTAGIVSGFPNGTFRPDAPLDRADAAQLMASAYALVHPLPPAPPPPAPTGLYLTSNAGYAGVAWSAVPGVAGYVVDRLAPAGSWVAVARTGATAWPDSSADGAVAYTYRIRAVGADGVMSAPSASVTEPSLSAQEVASLGAWHLPVSTLIQMQAVAHSAPGTPLDLHRLGYANLPGLPHTTKDLGGSTLVVSDDAETFYGPTLLEQATASGTTRVFYDHINGSGAPARVSVLLYNYGGTTVSYEVRSRVVDTAGGPKAQGELVAAVMLGGPWPGASGSLGPGQGVVLDPGAGYVAPWGAILGDYELSLSGPVHVAVAAVRSWQNALTEYIAHRLPPTVGGPGAGRGTFGTTTRVITLHPSASEPQMLLLGDGRQDPYLSGWDELTGVRVNDNGNYGLIYRIVGEPSVPTLLVAVPVGGGYYGALKSEGQVVAAPSYVLPTNAGIGFVVGAWQPGKVSEVDWTPPGGSYLPLELISIPLG